MRSVCACLVLGSGLWITGCGGTDTPTPAADAATDAVTDATPEAGGDVVTDVAPTDAPTDAPSSGCEGLRQMFWTWNLRVMPPPDVQVEAGCRVERPHLRVFSIDSVWGTALTDARATTIAHAWEDATPADPARGIYAIETGIFGDPPDLDHDPHVVLLYQDMGMFHGYTFDGFFRSMDESTTDPHSNQMEMLHIDAARMDPTNEYMVGVVAHEFVHLLAFQYGPEDVWLSEMQAEAGMVLTGYLGDLRLARTFATTARSPLVGNSAGMDYGPLFLFGDYLIERFGPAVIGEITRSRARGVASVSTALAAHGGATFRDVFGDWTVANFVDAARPPYGYAAFDITTQTAANPIPMGTASTQSAEPWAASYAQLDVPGTAATVNVTLDSTASANLVVRSIVFDPSARASAVVTAQTLTGASTTFAVTLPSGQRRLALAVANAATTAAPYTLTVAP